MEMDVRDALDVLKFELEFLEKGGYGRSPRTPWKPQLIFEDSPTCQHYDEPEKHGECGGCVLMQFVPEANRAEALPCRHIPLNAGGDTLDSLYRTADQFEIEATFAGWLRETIARLENSRHSGPALTMFPPPSLGSRLDSPQSMYHSLHPKCANPACPAAFHWLQGGKFFRFRNGDSCQSHKASLCDGTNCSSVGNPHDVKHYWLCERCSRMFTLTYDEHHGVMLKIGTLGLPEGLESAHAA